MAVICDVMRLIEIMTSLLTLTMAEESELYQIGVRFVPGMSALIYVSLCHFINYLMIIPFYKRDWKWLPVHYGDQRHAGLCLGRRPCMSHTWVQGRSQCTTLSAPALHNAALLTGKRVFTIGLYHYKYFHGCIGLKISYVFVDIFIFQTENIRVKMLQFVRNLWQRAYSPIIVSKFKMTANYGP